MLLTEEGARARARVVSFQGQVTVHWFIIDPAVIATNASNPPPTDQGNIGGEAIAPGETTNVNLRFGVQSEGSYFVIVNVEVLP